MRPIRKAAVLALSCCALFASPASAHHIPLVAHMTAEQEVPRPGPVGGAGAASINIDEHAARICYELVYTGIGPVMVGGIHRGEPGVAGPLVVNLEVATNGDEGCVGADATLVDDIHFAPDSYYVNLSTADFPEGAVRGQLQPVG